MDVPAAFKKLGMTKHNFYGNEGKDNGDEGDSWDYENFQLQPAAPE